MSTDHQQYSTANQSDAIARYSREHGLEVVRTYSDEGRSGLDIRGREGLRALLSDVIGGRADFGAVLVYDVSRWGRFQDCDESAFYEYLCRRAGIRVEYCMEQFRNDGTVASTVIKALKRVMAGEYSRELSEKVFAGKCRLIRLGFHQGGAAAFGLRRLVVDAEGRPRGLLARGQHKYLQSDRVLLVPGPPEEIREVRAMFRRVAYRGAKPLAIARSLNRRGVPTPDGRPWTRQRIVCMLTNEKYVGSMIFNKTTQRLKSPTARNPPDQWVRRDGAFTPVIDQRLFRDAQAAIARWSTRITNDAAIAALRALFERHGYLSADLINAAAGMPGQEFYEHRFGGLTRAYQLVGFEPTRDYRYLKGYAQRRRSLAALRSEVIPGLRRRGATVEHGTRQWFVVNGRTRVAVLFAFQQIGPGPPRWLAQLHMKPLPDWALVAQVDAEGLILGYTLASIGSQVVLLGREYRGRRTRHHADRLDPLLDLLASDAWLQKFTAREERQGQRTQG